MNHHSRHIIASLLIAILIASRAEGISPELLRAVPRDSLAVVFVDMPAADHTDHTDHASEKDELASAKNMSLLQTASGLWRQFGGGESAGLFADILDSLETLRQYPVAIVVTDVRARPLGEGSYRLSNLQAGLIVKTDGHHGLLTQRIQTLLSDLTTRESATITKTAAFGTHVYTLVDARFPEWATIRWAAWGNDYIIALGEDAFDAITSTLRKEKQSLANDPAFIHQHRDVGGLAATLEWKINFAGIRKQLEPPLWGRIEHVLATLRLNDVDRALWAVSQHERAIIATTIYTTSGIDNRVRLAVIAEANSPVGNAIPPSARAYAVIAHRPKELLYMVRDAYLSSRRASQRTKIAQIWRQFEAEKNVSVSHGLLDQFGEQLIIHTYPENPLGIPFLNTVLVPIAGSSDQAQATLDALLSQCAVWFFTDASNKTSNPFAPCLQRAADGVWFLRAGIYGPAITITNGWLVLSYSPYAVRQNAAFLSSRKDAPFAPPKRP